MMTPTEFNNFVKQINDAFGGLVERIEALEEEVKALKKPPARKAPTKKVEEKA